MLGPRPRRAPYRFALEQSPRSRPAAKRRVVPRADIYRLATSVSFEEREGANHFLKLHDFRHLLALRASMPQPAS